MKKIILLVIFGVALSTGAICLAHEGTHCKCGEKCACKTCKCPKN